MPIQATLGHMRGLLVVGALTAVAFFSFALPGEARTRACGTVAAPGYHAFNTKAKGLRCSSARRIVKHWLEADATPKSGPKGWKCHKSLVEPWSCRRDRARISFIFHSY
jgi:hypothetical protein